MESSTNNKGNGRHAAFEDGQRKVVERLTSRQGERPSLGGRAGEG
jgi:hypothetical protein